MSEKHTPEKHGAGKSEFALCGMAYDAFESGDADGPVVFVAPGELVTCEDCRAVMDNVRSNFKGYRATGEPK